MRIGSILTALVATWIALRPCAHAAGAIEDCHFDAFRDGARGRWEFRYGHKGGSSKATRPDWHCVSRMDPEAPRRGRYLSVEKKGRAAGTVFIGQRIKLPDPVPLWDLGVRYQAFCASRDRSGIVSLSVFSPKAWDALPSKPEDAIRPPPRADIFHQTVHPQGDDTLTWTVGRVGGRTLQATLVPHAGREVVVAVSFTAWHETSQEWARFDDFQLGSPLPHISAELWPRLMYPGEPLPLRVTAFSGKTETNVTLMTREAGSGTTWNTARMVSRGQGLYSHTLSPEQTHADLEVRATITETTEGELETGIATIRVAKRPSHPGLFYSVEELERMRAKISEFPWAKRIFNGLKKRADGWLTRPFKPEVICGWWWHHYGCHDCGGRLNMKGPHEHVCRSCGKTWDTEILFHVYWSRVHGSHAQAAHELALTYQMTGEERYAKRAIEFLLWYADHYADFPPSDKGGKVVSQTLDECVWLLQMMGAADLAYPAMTREQARNIEQDLIHAGAQYTRNYGGGIHNIRCWHNSCWAAAGYFVGDPEMVDHARNHKYGFVAQMKQGVLEDGMWYERSMGYHSYTVEAILYHLKAAMHAGDDLHKMPQVSKLLTFPIAIAFPNLVTPSLNDGGFSMHPIGVNHLELAAAWYNDPVALSALQKRYGTGASRTHGGLAVRRNAPRRQALHTTAQHGSEGRRSGRAALGHGQRCRLRHA